MIKVEFGGRSAWVGVSRMDLRGSKKCQEGQEAEYC